MQSGAENGMFVVSEISIHIFWEPQIFLGHMEEANKGSGPKANMVEGIHIYKQYSASSDYSIFSFIQQFRKMKKVIPDPNVLQQPEKENRS